MQNGGRNNSCLTSIAIGALTGAIAGATFNPALFVASKALGGAASTALGGVVSMAAAGAGSGALSSAATYAIETAVTGKEFSTGELLTSMALGAGTGAFAGAGYGLARAAPRLLGFGGKSLGAGQSAASAWRDGQAGLRGHLPRGLGPGTQYTDDALTLRNAAWDMGKPWPTGHGPGHIFGSVGWKIDSGYGWKGWYTLTGKIISLRYK